MKSLTLRLFEGTMLLFSISVAYTLFSMVTEDAGSTLFGIGHNYFLIPLIIANTIVIMNYGVKIVWKGMSVILLLWMIFVNINVLILSGNVFTDFIKVNLWTTTFYASYCLSKVHQDILHRYAILFLIIFSFSFVIYSQGKIYQMGNTHLGLESASNGIYCILTLLPLIMFLKNKKIVLCLLLLSFVATIFSSKRGASIIVLAIMYPTLKMVFQGIRSKFTKKIIVIATAGFLLFSLYYIGSEYLGGRLMERFDAIEERGGSGRTDIWQSVLSHFETSSLDSQLFGHGHYAVSLLGEASAAHNDFLDVLYDYGFVMLIIYIVLHIFIARRVYQLYKKKSEFSYQYTSMWFIFIVMSMVSILMVQQRYLIYIAAFWGAIEGNLSQEKILLKYRRK